MDDASVFLEKANVPTDEQVAEKLGAKYDLWVALKDHVMAIYPAGKQEWNFPGKKYGWSFRIKDKRRAILYFLPRDGYFMVAFVFGDKAMTAILESDVDQQIKTDLQNARKYAEGRGVRLGLNEPEDLKDIKSLIDIKMAF
jgi:hypothetical protein